MAAEHNLDTQQLADLTLGRFWRWLRKLPIDARKRLLGVAAISPELQQFVCDVVEHPVDFCQFALPLWQNVCTIQRPSTRLPVAVKATARLLYATTPQSAENLVAAIQGTQTTTADVVEFRDVSVIVVIGNDTNDTMTVSGCLDTALEQLQRELYRHGMRNLQPTKSG
jgi:hypothetical protein